MAELGTLVGFFTLLVGRAFHVETMSLRKTCAVLIRLVPDGYR